jgi:Electron transfer DM13.
MSRRSRIVLLAATAGAVALAVALALFQPWLLFVDVRVEESLPTAAPAPTTPAATEEPTPAVPVVLADGAFTSHEHATSGTATIVEQPDGSRVLAIADLDTSNGPDLHVWLSASDVVEGRDGWFVAGSAPFIDLGPLKGNLGDQVYDIPAEADLSGIRSVAIWCVRFSVSFGAAQLR